MNSMVKHVNSMEQVMIGIQEKFIESENERLKQEICIGQLIQENISTLKTFTPTSLSYKQCTRKSKKIVRYFYKVFKFTEQRITIYGRKLYF